MGRKSFKLTEEEIEEKKAESILKGREFYYFKCPVCGFTRDVNKYKTGMVNLKNINLKTYQIYQIRKGGIGHGGGFHRVSGKTLEEMTKEAEFQDFIQQVREQCKKVLKIIGD